MARPRVHDEALAEVLLDEATSIVGREGPEALSLRRITQAAGTSTSAIYSLYGSRDALLNAVYQRAIDSFAQAVVIDATDQPLTDLFNLGLAYREWALANPQTYPVMFGHRDDDTPEAILERTRSTVELLLQGVQRCLDAGLLEGTPRRIATQLWASVHGYVTLELDGLLEHSLVHDETGEDGPDVETLMRAAISYWRV